MSPSPGTLWRTVRHLSAAQLAYQTLHALRGTPRPAVWKGPPPAWALADPPAAFPHGPGHARWDGSTLELLNRAVSFEETVDWEAAPSPLWAFHLHQHDWVRGSEVPPSERAGLLLDWVERHRAGTGWHPAPISLRTFSWLKLLAQPGALALGEDGRARLRASLGAQLETLSRGLERRLRGNHLLSNLLALVAGGLALRGPRPDAWLGFANELRAELDEQVLADGAHVERSPMYHALMLEGVLDLLNLAEAAGRRAPPTLLAGLRDTASRMLGALRELVHPDRGLALFSDSAAGIAQDPEVLEGYAAALGVRAAGPSRPGVLDAAGYVRLAAGPWSLLASVAGPAPAYQPGHAHADALAFELCLERRRVVTDTGVYEYVPGPRRTHSRATRAHATLEVDGRDQAELWSAHRVGGRPRVSLDGVVPGRRLEARCRGWATPDTAHRRVIEVTPERVQVEDALLGRIRPARLVLPLAPGLEPALEGSRARLRVGSGVTLELELPTGCRFRTESQEAYPEFGRAVERVALVGESTGPGPFRWLFRLRS